RPRGNGGDAAWSAAGPRPERRPKWFFGARTGVRSEQHDAERDGVRWLEPAARRRHFHFARDLGVRRLARWLQRRTVDDSLAARLELHYARNEPQPRRAANAVDGPRRAITRPTIHERLARRARGWPARDRQGFL